MNPPTCRRGPDADTNVDSPALPEQKAELKETDLPKDVPTETEEPDQVVTTADSSKPKEEDEKIAAVQTTASTRSVAQEATAAPNLEGRLNDKGHRSKAGDWKERPACESDMEKPDGSSRSTCNFWKAPRPKAQGLAGRRV